MVGPFALYGYIYSITLENLLLVSECVKLAVQASYQQLE